MNDVGPEERDWQDAYADWWRSVKGQEWDDEQRLRNVMEYAWHKVPESSKWGAWDRYVKRYGWGVPRDR